MYLNIWMSPDVKPGEAHLEVTVGQVDGTQKVHNAEVFHGIILNSDHAEGQKIETWVVSALRNVLANVESSMFERLTSGQEPLTLQLSERNKY